MLSRFSRGRLYATPWTAAHQAPLSTGFSRQEYWSGLPFPSPLYNGLKLQGIHKAHSIMLGEISLHFPPCVNVTLGASQRFQLISELKGDPGSSDLPSFKWWWWCLVAQFCLAPCDPMDCSPPGSSVHGISQARILEWVDISFSRGFSPLRDQTRVCCIGRWILY